MKNSSNRGDTIVEVLIAIAIVSLVLGGAYAASQQSLGSGQRTQERAEATKLVQQQLERLKSAAATGGVFSQTGPFCLQNDLSIDTAPADCLKSGRYNLSIERVNTSTNTFRAQAVWDRLGGGDQEQVEAYYRVYPND
jgi:prepilin-type N-terminal cleavage/methylation domain-containing protein